MTTVEQIADAVLYEGYNLYPYRPSSIKNQQRWNFGLVYPANFSGVADGSGISLMQTECLALGGSSTRISVRVRFLQAKDRDIVSRSDGWQEAIQREVSLALALSDAPLKRPFRFGPEGNIPSINSSIEGQIELLAKEVQNGLYRVTLRISNLTQLREPAIGHEMVIPHTMISTHSILESLDGQFVSLLEPPDELRTMAADCCNIGTWPVLAGNRESRRQVLSSPIILYDYPEIAPESPGNLFDGAEIDEILTLRILTMTDEEKAEMRNSDERTRQMLERTEQLPPEYLAKLHGVLRDPRSAGGL
jgi:hydrogenase maturation protease